MLYQLYHFLRAKFKGFPVNPLTVLESLIKNEYLEREVREQFQLKKLQELITVALQNTEYYSSEWNDLPSMVNLTEIKKGLPITTKQTVRSNQQKFINTSIRKRFPHSTSGSTGIPIVTEISGLAQAYRIASILLFYRCWDIREKDRSVLIWGRSLKEKKKANMIDFFRKKLINRLDIDVLDINPKQVLTIVDRIQKFKPKYIRGYPSGLYVLAQLMRDNGLDFKNLNLKVAIVTGEMLYPHQRKLMEEIFSCKVANEYGSGECGLYAYECKKGSMHLNEDCVFLHTVNNKTLATELYNHGMPLINYNNGDRVIISDAYCSCGRTSRILESIEGRDEEFIIAPDGSEINPTLIYYIIEELKDIADHAFKQIRIIQSGNDFRVEVVPDKFTSRITGHIVKRMKEEIGNSITVNVVLVNEVTKDKSGKLRTFIRS